MKIILIVLVSVAFLFLALTETAGYVDKIGASNWIGCCGFIITSVLIGNYFTELELNNEIHSND